jgi:hypothetical protein
MWARDVSDSDSDYDEPWPRSRAGSRGPGRGQGRPVIPKLVIRQAGPTVTVSRQTLTSQDLAALATELQDLKRMNPATLPNIVRIALVTELAFALASKASTAGTGGTGSLAASSLDAVRHTAELRTKHEDELKHALLQVLSSVDPGTELPGTALVSLGRVCATHGDVEAQWKARLHESYDAWQRLQPLTVTAAPICPKSAEDLLARLVKVAGLTGSPKEEELSDWMRDASRYEAKLTDCNDNVRDLKQKLLDKQREVDQMTAELGTCANTLRDAQTNLDTAKIVQATVQKLQAELAESQRLLGASKAEAERVSEASIELEKRAEAAEEAVTRADATVRECQTELRGREDALSAATQAHAAIVRDLETRQAQEDATALGQLRDLYEKVVGTEALKSAGVSDLAEAIKTHCDGIVATQKAAEHVRQKYDALLRETAIFLTGSDKEVVTGKLSSVRRDLLAFADFVKEGESDKSIHKIVEAIRAKCARAAEHALAVPANEAAMVGERAETAALKEFRSHVVTLAGINEADGAIGDKEVIRAIRAKLDAIVQAAQDKVDAMRERAAAEAANVEAKAKAVDAASNARVAEEKERAAAEKLQKVERLVAEAEAAKAVKTQAENDAQAARAVQQQAEAATEVAESRQRAAEDALNAAEASAAAAAAEVEAAKEKLRTLNADATKTVATVGAASKTAVADSAAPVTANEERASAEATSIAAERAKAEAEHSARQLTELRTALKLNDDVDLVQAVETLIRAVEIAHVSQDPQQDDKDRTYRQFADKVLERFQSAPDDALDARLAAALEQINALLEAGGAVPQDDPRLAQLMNDIRGVIDLSETGIARGDGEACTQAADFLQMVLEFVKPVRDSFAQLTMRAGSRVGLTQMKANDLCRVLDATTPPPVQPLKGQRAGEIGASAVERAFELLATVHEQLTDVDDLKLPVDIGDRAKYLCTFAKDMWVLRPKAKTKGRKDPKKLTLADLVEIVTEWKDESTAAVDIRSIFKMDGTPWKEVKTYVADLMRGVREFHKKATGVVKQQTSVASTAAITESVNFVQFFNDQDVRQYNLASATRQSELYEQALADARDAREALHEKIGAQDELKAQHAEAIDELKRRHEAEHRATGRALELVRGGLIAKARSLTDTVRTHLDKLAQFHARRKQTLPLPAVPAVSSVGITSEITAWSSGRYVTLVTDEVGADGVTTSTTETFVSDTWAVQGRSLASIEQDTHVCLRHVGYAKEDVRVSDHKLTLVAPDGQRAFLVAYNRVVELVDLDASPEQQRQQFELDFVDFELIGVHRSGTYRYAIVAGKTKDNNMVVKGGYINIKNSSNDWIVKKAAAGLTAFRACAWASTPSVCIVVIPTNSGVIMVKWTTNDLSVVQANHVLQGCDVKSVDIRICDRGSVLALTIGSVVYVCDFNIATLRAGQWKEKQCVPHPTAGTRDQLLAVCIKVTQDRCFEGVTVAGSAGVNFYPWYELEPLTVFNAVHQAVTKVSDSLIQFADALERQEAAIDDTRPASGGASAHEIVAYGTVEAHEPQSSALLLDLLRW